MQYRSWLCVPGDSEDSLVSAVATGADVIVIDLADTDEYQKPMARQMAVEWLNIHRRQITGKAFGRWVRIGALDSTKWREDLVAVMQAAPDGIILSRAAGPQAVQHLAAEIYELEQLNQLPTGSTKVIPLVGETPASAMTIGTYVDASHPRLAGLCWSAEGLAAAISATRTHDSAGGWTETFRFVRAQLLLAAHARGMMAIDSPPLDGRADGAGLETAARNARADGFTGMLATDPAQVAAINEAFTPSEDDLAEARAVLAGCEASTAMVQTGQLANDQPELRIARRILGMEDGQTQYVPPRAPILRSA